MKKSTKIAFLGILGMLTMGILVTMNNAAAQESDLISDTPTCDGTGNQNMHQHGNQTGDHPGDGAGNQYKHNYNGTFSNDGICPYDTEVITT